MPFTKGKSGNPNGRPPVGKTVAELARKIGEGKRRGSKPLVERAIQKMFELAAAGDVPAFKAVMAYAYGMPKQQIEQDTIMEIVFAEDINTLGTSPALASARAEVEKSISRGASVNRLRGQASGENGSGQAGGN
jgi:hypothetical protein